MSHTLTNVLVHVVFATKNREKRLTAVVRTRLHAYLMAYENSDLRKCRMKSSRVSRTLFQSFSLQS